MKRLFCILSLLALPCAGQMMQAIVGDAPPAPVGPPVDVQGWRSNSTSTEDFISNTTPGNCIIMGVVIDGAGAITAANHGGVDTCTQPSNSPFTATYPESGSLSLWSCPVTGTSKTMNFSVSGPPIHMFSIFKEYSGLASCVADKVPAGLDGNWGAIAGGPTSGTTTVAKEVLFAIVNDASFVPSGDFTTPTTCNALACSYNFNWEERQVQYLASTVGSHQVTSSATGATWGILMASFK